MRTPSALASSTRRAPHAQRARDTHRHAEARGREGPTLHQVYPSTILPGEHLEWVQGAGVGGWRRGGAESTRFERALCSRSARANPLACLCPVDGLG